MVQPLPQHEPQIARIVLVINLRLSVHDQAADFEQRQYDHEHDHRRDERQRQRILQADGADQRSEKVPDRCGQQRAQHDAEKGKRHTNGALPPSQPDQRGEQEDRQQPDGHAGINNLLPEKARRKWPVIYDL